MSKWKPLKVQRGKRRNDKRRIEREGAEARIGTLNSASMDEVTIKGPAEGKILTF